MTEKEKRSRGELYDANYNPEIGKELLECKDKCFRYNQILPSHEEERHTAMEAILGKTGKQFIPAPGSSVQHPEDDRQYGNHSLEPQIHYPQMLPLHHPESIKRRFI